MSVARDDARAIFLAAVEAANPTQLVSRELRENPQLVNAIASSRHVLVIGGGKAGAAMALGVEQALASQLESVTGYVNIPDALACPTKRISLKPVRPPAFNEPTSQSVASTDTMLESLSRFASEDDLVICLLSGGGSALISALPSGISLHDKIVTTRLLTDGGATIADLNCVRKHISRIKGGQLAAASRAGSFWSLIISDVEGDRLDVIASGPTAADPSTFGEAMAIVERYCRNAIVPASVIDHLQNGIDGKILETPKYLAANVHNIVLANNHTALVGAQSEAERRGYRVLNCEPNFCDTTIAAKNLTKVIHQVLLESHAPVCVLSGGETTSCLPPMHGLGGRNQQLALEIGDSLTDDEMDRVTILCAGTDGEDGPTDAAGAFMDADVLDTADAMALDRRNYLSRHDSYHFFEQSGGLLKTGLTGTNVMDIHMALIRPT